MNMEKFTKKSLEAIREAQQVAIEHQNMQIDQQHLLYALIAQQEGLIPQLFTALNIEPQRVLSACEREIERIPKVSGPGRDPEKVYISQSVDAALNEAEKQAEQMDIFMETSQDSFASAAKVGNTDDAEIEKMIENQAGAGEFSDEAIDKELEELRKKIDSQMS